MTGSPDTPIAQIIRDLRNLPACLESLSTRSVPTDQQILEALTDFGPPSANGVTGALRRRYSDILATLRLLRDANASYATIGPKHGDFLMTTGNATSTPRLGRSIYCRRVLRKSV